MLTEAAIIAVSRAVEAVSNVIIEAMKGQTPEQKKQLWDWYVKDIENWRKFWGIDKKE